MTIFLSQSNEQKFDHLITQYAQKPALWPALMYTVEFLCFTNIGKFIKELSWMVQGAVQSNKLMHTIQ